MNTKVRKAMVVVMTICLLFGTMCIPTYGVTTTTNETLPDGTEVTTVETVTTDPETNTIKTIISIISVLKKVAENAAENTELPPIVLALEPGEQVEGTASGEYSFKDNEPEAGAENYDYLNTITKVDRKATATAGEISSEKNQTANIGLLGVGPVPDANKQHIEVLTDGAPYGSWIEYFHLGNDGKYYPIINGRTEAEYEILPEDVKSKYDKDAATGLYVPDGDVSFESIKNGVHWDYVMGVLAEIPMSGGMHFKAKDSAAKNRGISMMCFFDRGGNKVYTYCMDAETATELGVKYTVENIDNADYVPTGQDGIEHIKACVRYGYWGSDEGVGSLDKLKKDLEYALNDGMEVNYTFKARVGDEQNVDSYTYNSNDDKDKLLDMIDDISEGEALQATQIAIWHFGNRSRNIDYLETTTFKSYDPEAGGNIIIYGTDNSEHAKAEARINLIVEYLISDYLMEISKQSAKETVIIDKNNFISDGSLKLTIGDRVDEEAAVVNEQGGEIYMTDLSFKMDVKPTSKDDLTVTLKSKDGSVSRTAYLGKKEKDNNENFEIKDGEYTFKNIPLREGIKLNFTIDIDGDQYLEEGVYFYTPTQGTKIKQATVGLAKGNKKIDVSSEFDLEYQVILEQQQVTFERHQLTTTYEKSGDDVGPGVGGDDINGDGTGGGQGDGTTDNQDNNDKDKDKDNDGAPNTGDVYRVWLVTIMAIMIMIMSSIIISRRWI